MQILALIFMASQGFYITLYFTIIDIMTKTKEEILDKAAANFKEGYACSQAVLLAFSPEYGLDDRHAKLLSGPFGGGMGRLRRTCGALTGAFMVIGLDRGNELPTDMETKLSSYRDIRSLTKQFEEVHESSICKEILSKVASTNEVEQRKHHRLICDRCVATATALVYDIVADNK